MSFRLKILLEEWNDGHIYQYTTRYDLHWCNVDFTWYAPQNGWIRSQHCKYEFQVINVIGIFNCRLYLWMPYKYNVWSALMWYRSYGSLPVTKLYDWIHPHQVWVSGHKRYWIHYQISSALMWWLDVAMPLEMVVPTVNRYEFQSLTRIGLMKRCVHTCTLRDMTCIDLMSAFRGVALQNDWIHSRQVWSRGLMGGQVDSYIPHPPTPLTVFGWCNNHLHHTIDIWFCSFGFRADTQSPSKCLCHRSSFWRRFVTYANFWLTKFSRKHFDP